MPIPPPARAMPLPALRTPAQPRSPAAAAAAGPDPVRQVLERTWRAPAARGAAKPPFGTGGPRVPPWVLAVQALLSLGGSSRLRDPRQQLLPTLAQRQANLGRTFEALDGVVNELTAWPDTGGARARMRADLTRERARILADVEQRPERAAIGLARVFERMGLQPLGSGDPDRGRVALAREIVGRSRPGPSRSPLGALRDVRGLSEREGRAWSPATQANARAFRAQAEHRLAQPLSSERGSTAVRALGDAIRNHAAQPDATRRTVLNHSYAFAKSLRASEGADWTPATRAGFASYGRQAERALWSGRASTTRPTGPPEPGRTKPPVPARPELPAPRSETAHTRSFGAMTGAGVAEIEQRARAERAQALETALEAFARRRRMLLPVSSAETLARRVHAERGGPGALGVSEDTFVVRAMGLGSARGNRGETGFSASAQGGRPSGPSSGPAAWDLRSMPSDLDPTDWNGYFGPRLAHDVRREFSMRYGLDPGNVSTHHDTFAHLLQPRVERPEDDEPIAQQFTAIVDEIIFHLVIVPGSTLEEARAGAIAEFDDPERLGPGRSSFLVDYILEQIRANAELNDMSVATFIAHLTDPALVGRLLLKRPTHHPLEAGPPKFDRLAQP